MSLAINRFAKIPTTASTYVSGVFSNHFKPLPMKNVEDHSDENIPRPENSIVSTTNGLKTKILSGLVKAQTTFNRKTDSLECF